jgi:hypothetical protein
MAGIYPRAPGIKVFCFFSSEKKNLLLSSEKEANRLLFVGRGEPKSGIWPESDVKSIASRTRQEGEKLTLFFM